MATYTSAFSTAQSTTANIRNFLAFIENTLTAAGWVQTSDTGQATSAAITSAGVANTSAGYQIWRMNDSLQATKPVYLKIELGAGSTTTYFAWWTTLGTGSNGTGTITGTLWNRYQSSASATSGTNVTSWGSGTTSSIVLVCAPATTNAGLNLFLVIERTKDNTGADTNAGVVMFTLGTTPVIQYIAFSGTSGTPTGSVAVPLSHGLTTLASGNNVGLVPVLPVSATGATNPMRGLIMYYGPDTAANNVISVTIGGVAHSYLCIATGLYTTTQPVPTEQWASNAMAFLYE